MSEKPLRFSDVATATACGSLSSYSCAKRERVEFEGRSLFDWNLWGSRILSASPSFSTECSAMYSRFAVVSLEGCESAHLQAVMAD